MRNLKLLSLLCVVLYVSSIKGCNDLSFQDHIQNHLPADVLAAQSVKGGLTKNMYMNEGIMLDSGKEIQLGASVRKGANWKWHNMKVVLDYESMQSMQNTEKRDYLVTYLMPMLQEYLEKTMMVQEMPQKVQVEKDCANGVFGSAFAGKTVDGDLVILVTAEDKPNDSWVAWASACYLHEGSSRPIMGRINFNLAFLKTDKTLTWDTFGTAYHELVHILGFSPQLFSYFVNWNADQRYGQENVLKTVQAGSKTHSMVVTPKVKQWVREHFNCNNLEGAPTEDEGGSGSKGAHWEQLYFGSEYMSAASIINPVISGLTVAFLEDSGWYRFNWSAVGAAGHSTLKPEPVWWLKDYGCNVYSDKCPKTPFSCDGEAQGTAGQVVDYTFMGACGGKGFSNGCRFYTAGSWGESDCRIQDNAPTDFRDWGAFYGFYSRSFVAKVTNKTVGRWKKGNFCFKPSSCIGSTLKVMFGSEQLTCTANGSTVSGGDSKLLVDLQCPNNIADFCSRWNSKCENDCSVRGRCMEDGKCLCYTGFTGTDCGKDRNGNAIVGKGCGDCRNGTCNAQTNQCLCKQGYTGNDCSKKDKNNLWSFFTKKSYLQSAASVGILSLAILLS